MPQFNIPNSAARCVVMINKSAEVNLRRIVSGLTAKFGNNPKVVCGSGAIKIECTEQPIDVTGILDAGNTKGQDRIKAGLLMRKSYGKMLTIAYGDKQVIDKAVGRALGKVVKKTNPSNFHRGIKPNEVSVIYFDQTNKVVGVEKQEITVAA